MSNENTDSVMGQMAAVPVIKQQITTVDELRVRQMLSAIGQLTMLGNAYPKDALGCSEGILTIQCEINAILKKYVDLEGDPK